MSQIVIEVFINIYGEEFLVGKLAYKSKIIYFEYDKSFLSKGIEISPYKLPLKSGVFVCDDGIFEGLFGVFGDSLPDGWGRLLLDRYLMQQNIKYSDITQLDRLRYIGDFGIGALKYRPIYEKINSCLDDIVLDTLAYESTEILKDNSTKNIENFIVLGGSSAGARPKAMIQINKKGEFISGMQKLKAGFSHYIVKFASSFDNIDIGKIEYIYSLMAREAGINMTKTQLLEGTDNSYFSIERFDRDDDNPVHIHSVAGLTHSDFRMPVLDYDDLLGLTLHLTKDNNEVLKMYRLACFNLYVHNRDDHAKNFSFILDKEYNWKLSPAYDLTFSFGPCGEHSTTYLGEGKNPTIEHLQKLANKHNIKNYKKIISEINISVRNFARYANQFKLKKQTSDLISKSLALIDNAV